MLAAAVAVISCRLAPPCTPLHPLAPGGGHGRRHRCRVAVSSRRPGPRVRRRWRSSSCGADPASPLDVVAELITTGLQPVAVGRAEPTGQQVLVHAEPHRTGEPGHGVDRRFPQRRIEPHAVFQVVLWVKFLLTVIDGHHMVDKRQSEGCFKPPLWHFASTVTRGKNRVEMIKIHRKRVLMASCEGLRPAPSAAVAR